MRRGGGREEESLPQHRHHRAGEGAAPDLGGEGPAAPGLAVVGQTSAPNASRADRLHSACGFAQ